MALFNRSYATMGAAFDNQECLAPRGFVRNFPHKLLARLRTLIYRISTMKNSSNPVTQTDLQRLSEDLRNEVQSFKQEVIEHFDLVFEKYAHDMRGAAQDEFVMLKDRQGDHEQRITRLESNLQPVG